MPLESIAASESTSNGLHARFRKGRGQINASPAWDGQTRPPETRPILALLKKRRTRQEVNQTSPSNRRNESVAYFSTERRARQRPTGLGTPASPPPTGLGSQLLGCSEIMCLTNTKLLVSAPPLPLVLRRDFRTRAEPSEFKRGGFTERSSNSAPNTAPSLCTCRLTAEAVRNTRSAARAMDPAWANSTRARKSSSKGTS
jgi:hypothetical protein